MSEGLSSQAGMVAAFVASLVTGAFTLVSLTLSKEQKISEFRQDWIDNLRKDLSRFFALVGLLSGSLHAENVLGAEQTQRVRPGLGERLPAVGAEAREVLERIKLRLNPEEPNHERLFELLRSAFHRANTVGKQNEAVLELERMIGEASDFARPVLKSEWEVVKKGEPTFRYIRMFALPVILLITVAFLALLSCG